MISKQWIVSSILLLVILVGAYFYLGQSAQVSDSDIKQAPTEPKKVFPHAIKKTQSASVSDTTKEQNGAPETVASSKLFVEMTLEELQALIETAQEIDCNQAEGLDSDSQIARFNRFVTDEMIGQFDKLKPYSTFSESELLDVAISGDVLAMYALGLNYRSYAKEESFTAREILYDRKAYEYKPKNYDDEAMQKSKRWLFDAAKHGYFSALVELMQTIQVQEKSLKRNFEIANGKDADSTELDQRLMELNIEKLAYTELLLTILPEFSSGLKNEDIASYSEAIEELTDSELDNFAILFDSLDKDWRDTRNSLNLPITYELGITVDEMSMGAIKMTLQNYCSSEMIRFRQRNSVD